MRLFQRDEKFRGIRHYGDIASNNSPQVGQSRTGQGRPGQGRAGQGERSRRDSLGAWFREILESPDNAAIHSRILTLVNFHTRKVMHTNGLRSDMQIPACYTCRETYQWEPSAGIIRSSWRDTDD